MFSETISDEFCCVIRRVVLQVLQTISAQRVAATNIDKRERHLEENK